jgi:hypothetical protein
MKLGGKGKDSSGVIKKAYSSHDVDRIVHDAARREKNRLSLTDGQRKTIRRSAA